MSVHSSIFAWRIPRTQETGELQSRGSQRASKQLTMIRVEDVFKEDKLPMKPMCQRRQEKTNGVQRETEEWEGNTALFLPFSVFLWLSGTEQKGKLKRNQGARDLTNELTTQRAPRDVSPPTLAEETLRRDTLTISLSARGRGNASGQTSGLARRRTELIVQWRERLQRFHLNSENKL